jgi:hypothetical protein
MASIFFDEMLVPAVEEECALTNERFSRMVREFQIYNPTAEVTLQHVWAVGWGRTKEFARQAAISPSAIPPEAQVVRKAWEKLNSLLIENTDWD